MRGSGQNLAPQPITWGALLCLGLGGGLGHRTASSSAILRSHSAELGREVYGGAGGHYMEVAPPHHRPWLAAG